MSATSAIAAPTACTPLSTAMTSNPSSAERLHRRPDRRVADDEDARSGEQRLEEHLDRATGQARVLDRRRSLLFGSLPTDAVVLAGRSVGKYS